MRNIKLTIQYDGSAYVGWQRQSVNHGLSVQQAIEIVLAKVCCGNSITLHGAGRTDSGVHALAQVASFACPTNIPVQNLAAALNNLLPYDIRITAAEEVPEDFHARFSATGKRYRYLLATDKPDAFNFRWYWHINQLPDAEIMGEAASFLLGRHDFRHFTLTKASVTNFTREIRSLRVYVPQPEELPCRFKQALAIEVTGSGFLYKMVRLIAARLLAVGQGKLPPCAMEDFFRGEPPLRLPPAPAQGLMLMQVYYD